MCTGIALYSERSKHYKTVKLHEGKWLLLDSRTEVVADLYTYLTKQAEEGWELAAFVVTETRLHGRAGKGKSRSQKKYREDSDRGRSGGSSRNSRSCS